MKYVIIILLSLGSLLSLGQSTHTETVPWIFKMWVYRKNYWI